MTTTTVKKGTGRAAATAKRTKAAQKAQPAAAVEPIDAPAGDAEAKDAYAAQLSAMKIADLRTAAAEAGIDHTGFKKAELVEALADRMASRTAQVEQEPNDNLDSMSLGEVRKLAVAQGWSTGTKGSKREIIALLRKYPDGPRSAPAEVQQPAKKAPAKATKKAPAKAAAKKQAVKKQAVKTAAEESDANAARCARSYDRMVEVGGEWGWSVTRSGEKEITAFNTKDQAQTLVVTYPEPGQDIISDEGKYPNSPLVRHHRSSDHKGRRLLNVSAALKVMRGEIK